MSNSKTQSEKPEKREVHYYYDFGLDRRRLLKYSTFKERDGWRERIREKYDR